MSFSLVACEDCVYAQDDKSSGKVSVIGGDGLEELAGKNVLIVEVLKLCICLALYHSRHACNIIRCLQCLN